MPTHTKPHENSPLDLLTELAVEGSSSLVEAQRTLLDLAQQENEIIMTGVKEQVGAYLPAVAVTDLVRRSLDTLIGMQHELLTATSKQTLQWLEPEQTRKGDRTAQMIEFAREGVETFTNAQKKFLDVVGQETVRVTSGRQEHEKHVRKTEITKLAREAGSAFIEAQKRLLDVMGQQMNVNLDVATRTLGMMSPSSLLPMANLTGEGFRNFMNSETSLIGSLIKQTGKPARKVAKAVKSHRTHQTRRPKAVTV